MNKILFLITIILFYQCGYQSPSEQKPNIAGFEQQLIPSIQVTNETRYFDILERMEHYKVPGMSIAIVKDRKIQFAKGYGLAQKQKGIKTKENTLFKTGSISKSITAVLVMKLVETEVIDLDEDIRKYLKIWQLPDDDWIKNHPITLRMLLSHTAGIKNINAKGYQQGELIPSLNDQLAGKGNTPPISFQATPGTTFNYANPGYMLIQKVIEDVTEQSLATLAKQLVFEPLKMENTMFEPIAFNPNDTTISYAYNRQGQLIDGYWFNNGSAAVGGLWSTSTDLAKFYLAIHHAINNEDGFIPQPLAQALVTLQKENYGLGFYLKGEKDSLILSHSGKSVGYTTYLIGYAHTGDAVIILTNGDNGGYLFSEILRGLSSIHHWDFLHPKLVKAVPLNRTLVEAYKGTYQFESGDEKYTLSLQEKDHRLVLLDVDESGIDTLEIRAVNDTSFVEINDGDEFVMRKTRDSIQHLIWNKAYDFKKLEYFNKKN